MAAEGLSWFALCWFLAWCYVLPALYDTAGLAVCSLSERICLQCPFLLNPRPHNSPGTFRTSVLPQWGLGWSQIFCFQVWKANISVGFIYLLACCCHSHSMVLLLVWRLSWVRGQGWNWEKGIVIWPPVPLVSHSSAHHPTAWKWWALDQLLPLRQFFLLLSTSMSIDYKRRAGLFVIWKNVS